MTEAEAKAERLERMKQAILRRRRLAQAAGEKMFMGIPDAWYDDPHWRCPNNHVSSRYLMTEERGDRCLRCQEPVMLTFPTDRDGTELLPV